MSIIESKAEVQLVREGRTPPVGPNCLPILGHLLELKKDKLGFMSRCVEELGDVVMMKFGRNWPVVLVSDPELIEPILMDKPRALRKSRFFWRHVDALFGKGIIVANGEAWTRQRRMMTPAFSAKRVYGYLPNMTAAAGDLVDSWKSGETRDIHQDMIDLSLTMALKTLFDLDDKDVVKRIGHENNEIAREISARSARPFVIPDWVPLPGHRRYAKGIKYIDDYIAGVMAERRADPGDRGDFFSQLMAERDEDGAPLSDKLLRDEALNILAAGHETTALGLTWALYMLAMHPEIQEAVHEEVVEVLSDGRSPGPEDLKLLRKTENVVMETLRLYPPVWFLGRASGVDMQVGEYLIPAGSSIYMIPWIIHRNPKYFVDPLVFDPDRWTREFARSLPKCAFMPFSVGPRTCIGRSFSMVELVAVMAMLCRDYRYEWRGTTARLDPSIGLRPLDPMLLGVVRR